MGVGMGPRDPAQDDLRATSDAIVDDIALLAALEDRKRQLAPDDPEVAILADRIVELAARLKRHSIAQRELSQEIATDGAHDGGEPIGG